MSRHEKRPNNLNPIDASIERIVKDPALRDLSLREGIDVCVDLWSKNHVPQEDIDKRKQELLETIDNGVSQKQARRMLSSFFRLRRDLDQQNSLNGT